MTNRVFRKALAKTHTFAVTGPTWFGRTAGGWVKSTRKAAACATSHSRAATGPCGGRGRRAGAAVFFVCFAAEGMRAGSWGCGMPDLKRLGSLRGQGSIGSPLASQPDPPRHRVRTSTGPRRPPEAKATKAGHGRKRSAPGRSGSSFSSTSAVTERLLLRVRGRVDARMAGRMAVLRGGDLNGPASPRQRWSVPQHNTQ